MPAISVIMAAYNGASLIADSIRSVLAQTFTDFELIVVDDCSTDNTIAVVRSFDDPRIRLLSTPRNSGPVGARNQAMAASSGRTIAALDQDDLCLPNRLARQFAHMERHPRTVVLGTAARRLVDGRTQPDRLPRRTTPAFTRWLLHVQNPLIWSSVMLRADAVRRLPVFERVERQYAEDYDLYHRLSALGEIARLDEVLTTYRWHPEGASRRREAQMTASATAVLADACTPWFGAAARANAALMIRHISCRQPVPDLATLRRLRHILAAVRTAFLTEHQVDASSTRLIAAESRRLHRFLAAGLLKSSLRLPATAQAALRL